MRLAYWNGHAQIATSGCLMIGVNDVPPIPPRLEWKNSRPAFRWVSACLHGPAGSGPTSSAASSKISFSSQSRITGTTSPLGVSTAMPIWNNFFITRFSPDSSNEALKNGNSYSAATLALIRNTSGVSLNPLFLRLAGIGLAVCFQRRDFSQVVLRDIRDADPVAVQIRAGNLLDLRQRLDFNLAVAAEIDLGWGGSSKPRPLDAGAAAPVMTALTKASTSSRIMRPPRPLPVTRDRSIPSSRANRRMAGLAYGKLVPGQQPDPSTPVATAVLPPAAVGAGYCHGSGWAGGWFEQLQPCCRPPASRLSAAGLHNRLRGLNGLVSLHDNDDITL